MKRDTESAAYLVLSSPSPSLFVDSLSLMPQPTNLTLSSCEALSMPTCATWGVKYRAGNSGARFAWIRYSAYMIPVRRHDIANTPWKPC